LWRRRRPKAGVAPDPTMTPPAAHSACRRCRQNKRRERYNKHSRRRQGRDLIRKQLARPLSAFISRVKLQVKYEVKVGCVPLFTSSLSRNHWRTSSGLYKSSVKKLLFRRTFRCCFDLALPRRMSTTTSKSRPVFACRIVCRSANFCSENTRTVAAKAVLQLEAARAEWQRAEFSSALKPGWPRGRTQSGLNIDLQPESYRPLAACLGHLA